MKYTHTWHGGDCWSVIISESDRWRVQLGYHPAIGRTMWYQEGNAKWFPISGAKFIRHRETAEVIGLQVIETSGVKHVLSDVPTQWIDPIQLAIYAFVNRGYIPMSPDRLLYVPENANEYRLIDGATGTALMMGVMLPSRENFIVVAGDQRLWHPLTQTQVTIIHATMKEPSRENAKGLTTPPFPLRQEQVKKFFNLGGVGLPTWRKS